MLPRELPGAARGCPVRPGAPPPFPGVPETAGGGPGAVPGAEFPGEPPRGAAAVRGRGSRSPRYHRESPGAGGRAEAPAGSRSPSAAQRRARPAPPPPPPLRPFPAAVPGTGPSLGAARPRWGGEGSGTETERELAAILRGGPVGPGAACALPGWAWCVRELMARSEVRASAWG